MSEPAQPSWLVDGMNIAAGNFRLILGTREEITSAPFLDARFTKGREPRLTSFANADKLIGARPLIAPVYIFHTAFCCSTLLARALDLAGSVYSLKEPNLMMELANARRIGSWSKDVSAFRAGLIRATKLVSSLAPADETPLIKPTNAANNLLPYLLETDPAAKVLVIHSDLESFLISVLKKGEEGRSFIRFLFNILMFDLPFTRDMAPRDQMRLTDLQVAALVWRLQSDPLKRAFGSGASARIASLHVDRFLQDQGKALADITGFLGLNFPQKAIDDVLAGPVLKQDPKQTDTAYSTEQRTSEMDQIRAQFKSDIARTVNWVGKIPVGGFDDGTFPNPLGS
jgi:hypothetical protein